MLRAEKAGVLQHAQVVGTVILLAIAGNETTTKLIVNMAYRLWQHPDQRQLLIDDPSLIGNAVEETLRFDGSSQIIVRRAGKDVTMRSEEHTSELQSLMRISYAVFCLKKKKRTIHTYNKHSKHTSLTTHQICTLKH